MAYNGKICLGGGIDMDFTVFQGISILIIFNNSSLYIFPSLTNSIYLTEDFSGFDK